MAGRNFFSRRVHEARPRQVQTLLKQGWSPSRAGGYWLSPYSNLCYPERIAIDVESLRGTFKKQWIQNGKNRQRAKIALG